MPTFEPAAPVAPGIQSDYGATEQWNKTFPALAGLYEAAGRNANQAAGETARNQTQTNISSGELDTRQRMQYVQDRAAQDQQERQFQQQSDLQNQAAFNEAALSGIKVSQVEQAHMQRQQNAVNSILQMTNDGTLDMTDPEVAQQVKDAIFEAKTGINQTQRRLQAQQADDQAAQAQLRRTQAANIEKDNADAQAFQADMIEAGHSTFMMTDPNGRRHVMIKNDQNGEWYNPLLQHMKGGSGDGPSPSRYGDDNTGEFSYAKAQKEVEAEAKAAYPVIHEKGEDGKGTVDVNERNRATYTQELYKRKSEEHRNRMQSQQQNLYGRGGETRPVPGGPQGQTEGPDQGSGEGGTSAVDPGQQAQAANDQRDALPKIVAQIPDLAKTEKQRIDSLPISNTRKSQVKEYIDAVAEIASKPFKSDEDRQKIATYQRLIDEQTR